MGVEGRSQRGERFGIGSGISTFRRQFKRKTVGSWCGAVGWRACACLRITCRQQVLVDRGRTPHPPPPPTFVKYFVLFFVLFRSVPGEPDAGLTHFLSTPRLHTRPHIFPAPSAPPQRNRSGQKNKKTKQSNKPSSVSESVSWRATSSSVHSHTKHDTCSVCGKREKKNKKTFPQ